MIGGIGEMMPPVDEYDNYWLGRFFFDMFFFVIIIVIGLVRHVAGAYKVFETEWGGRGEKRGGGFAGFA